MTLQPFTEEHWPLLWEWMQDSPQSNLDDTGPENYEHFASLLRTRLEEGEALTGIFVNDQPVGAIGTASGRLHGICFAPAHQGTGIAAEALTAVLAQIDQERPIEASYYATNARIAAFLAKAGFVEVERLPAAVTQQGCPVDVIQVRLGG